jgi:CrcB protein
MIVLGIALAGAIGAPARYLVDRLVQRRFRFDLPGGTFIVNVSGSLLLGLVSGAAMYHGLTTTPRLLLGTGFCGAYTTFSTAMLETVELASDGRQGAVYLAASTLAGTAAAAAGLVLAGAL